MRRGTDWVPIWAEPGNCERSNFRRKAFAPQQRNLHLINGLGQIAEESGKFLHSKIASTIRSNAVAVQACLINTPTRCTSSETVLAIDQASEPLLPLHQLWRQAATISSSRAILSSRSLMLLILAGDTPAYFSFKL